MLLDTSGLLAILHKAEEHHEAAKEHYFAAGRRITHSYVLSELVAVAHARKLPRPGTLNFMTELLASTNVQVVWVAEPLHRAGVELLEARLDKTYSLCDAVSFVLKQQLVITDALTTDRHFTQEGFVRLLA